VDVTVSELALETFFPADEFTLGVLQALAEQRRVGQTEAA
jgi:hypothetical protein